MNKAIGGVELSSMALGYAAADAMLKAAGVDLVLSRTVCPGKFLALVSGAVADVRASVEAGAACSGDALVDSFVIASVHPDLFPAIAQASGVGRLEALGIVETFSAASLIEAADAAAKSAPVRLIDVRLAMALGGKAFATFTGSVAAVETAAAAAAESAGAKGLLSRKVVIAQPRPELFGDIL
jgi:microcompartment protein CcmL/EutN